MVVLRPATDADSDLLLEIFESSRPDFALIPLAPNLKSQLVAQQQQAQQLHYAAAYPSAQYLVIEADGTAIGQLILWRDDSQLRVIDLAVLPAFRGHGIGRQLVMQLQDQAKDAGLPLQLAVWGWNDGAMRLYRTLGFRQTGEDAGYVQLRWEAGVADSTTDYEQKEVG